MVVLDGSLEGYRDALQRTSGCALVVERVGRTLEARISPDDEHDDGSARLRLDVERAGLGLTLDATLPEGAGRVFLMPQRGWRGVIGGLFERPLQRPALDDAYLVFADDAGAALARASEEALLGLAPHLEDLTLAGQKLRAHVALSSDGAALTASAERLVRVYETALSVRRGFALP